MESAATLSTFVEDAAERSAPSDDDPWSGEWHGLFNFDKKKRDQHLATLKVPWVLRKMVGVVMRKEGQVNGVVKYVGASEARRDGHRASAESGCRKGERSEREE
jgi:hypothetical protein